jgi:XTP/dITP diphosphohydrolase
LSAALPINKECAGAPPRVVLASGNPGKLRELRALLAPLDWRVDSQDDFRVPPVEETALTFAENALLKARNACRHAGLPALADDSGIAVDVLDGEPGIRSARYAGPQADDQRNLELLLERARASGDPRPAAHFHCAMAYLRDARDPAPVIAQGSWHGYLVFEPRGANGFGYDPVFFVPTHGCTSAELPAEVKNRISHRALALHELIARLSGGQA